MVFLFYFFAEEIVLRCVPPSLHASSWGGIRVLFLCAGKLIALF